MKTCKSDHLCHEFILEMPTLHIFLRTFTINVLQPGEWIQQLAAHHPSRSSAGTRLAPANTAYPCSWDAHRRPRHLQTLCRSGRDGCASARGRLACCPLPPWTDLQSLVSPKPSASMNFPPARKRGLLQTFEFAMQGFNQQAFINTDAIETK